MNSSMCFSKLESLPLKCSELICCDCIFIDELWWWVTVFFMFWNDITRVDSLYQCDHFCQMLVISYAVIPYVL
jgi:hypothetical protein